MENEKVAKKKTADILLKLFEWCFGHTEVHTLCWLFPKIVDQDDKEKKRGQCRSENKRGQTWQTWTKRMKSII